METNIAIKEIKRVYVAKDYFADTAIETLKNAEKTEKVCTELFRRGYAPFWPWGNEKYRVHCCHYINGKRRFNYQQFHAYAIAWLEVSDVLLILPHFIATTGVEAEEEIIIATKKGIPIFHSINDLPCIQ